MSATAAYQPKKGSPTALTVVILLHGAALAALAMAKFDVIPSAPPPPTILVDIDDAKPPPPEPVERAEVVKPSPVPPIFVPTPTLPPVKLNPIETTVEPQPVYPPIYEPVIEPAPVQKAEPTPPPPPKKVQAARAKANLASYVSDSDYPINALRSEDQGTTRFRLTVGANGRVTNCEILSSSGSSALDAATCRIMKSRARFTPARNDAGQPTSDSVSSAIRWVLPD